LFGKLPKNLPEDSLWLAGDDPETLAAFEFKWWTTKRVKFPASFLEAYPGSITTVIDKENFEGFVGLE
jgi:hypothetical protein